MAFCFNCGTQLDESSKFCTKCGTPIESAQAAPAQASQPAHQPLPVIEHKPEYITVLRVLSIIGIAWFTLWYFADVVDEMMMDMDTAIGCSILISGYAIAHAIVAIVQGSKHGIKPLKIMGVIGIVLYVFSSCYVIGFAEDEFTAAVCWAFGLVYALAFSIVSLVKAKIPKR